MLSSLLADGPTSQDNGMLLVSVLVALLGAVGLLAASIVSSRKSDQATTVAEGKADEANHAADLAKIYAEQINRSREEERHLRGEAKELYDTLRRQYDSLVDDLSDARERLTRVEQENDHLAGRVDHLEAENRRLVQERDRLRDRVRVLEKAITDLGGIVPPERGR